MELIQQFHDRDLASVKALFFIFWHLIIWQEFDFLYGNFFVISLQMFLFSLELFLADFLEGNLQSQKGQKFYELAWDVLKQLATY